MATAYTSTSSDGTYTSAESTNAYEHYYDRVRWRRYHVVRSEPADPPAEQECRDDLDELRPWPARPPRSRRPNRIQRSARRARLCSSAVRLMPY